MYMLCEKEINRNGRKKKVRMNEEDGIRREWFYRRNLGGYVG